MNPLNLLPDSGGCAVLLLAAVTLALVVACAAMMVPPFGYWLAGVLP